MTGYCSSCPVAKTDPGAYCVGRQDPTLCAEVAKGNKRIINYLINSSKIMSRDLTDRYSVAPASPFRARKYGRPRGGVAAARDDSGFLDMIVPTLAHAENYDYVGMVLFESKKPKEAMHLLNYGPIKIGVEYLAKIMSSCEFLIYDNIHDIQDFLLQLPPGRVPLLLGASRDDWDHKQTPLVSAPAEEWMEFINKETGAPPSARSMKNCIYRGEQTGCGCNPRWECKIKVGSLQAGALATLRDCMTCKSIAS